MKDYDFKISLLKEQEENVMTQSNQVLATIARPENEWEMLIDDDANRIEEELSTAIEETASSKKRKQATSSSSRRKHECPTTYRLTALFHKD